MRKLIFCIVSVAAALALVACNKELTPGGDSMLVVDWQSAGATKGSKDLEGNEGTINSLVIYVFDHNGMLDIAKTCSTDEINSKRASVDVKTGMKTVYAVANLTGEHLAAANACTKLAQLKGVELSLSDNTLSNFVMVGHGTKDHQSTNASTPVQLDLYHPVAKVRLGGVTNNLPAPYGAMTVKQVFLCNIVGNQVIGGFNDPSPVSFEKNWLNKSGTDGDGTNKEYTIGRGTHAADVPALTYHALSESVSNGGSVALNKLMYAMPNSSTAEYNGYPATFSPTASVLMVVITILGKDYYYPVSLYNSDPSKGAVINGLDPNTDYTINLTVKGLGNTYEDGPFKRIVKETLVANVDVALWTGVDAYTETI